WLLSTHSACSVGDSSGTRPQSSSGSEIIWRSSRIVVPRLPRDFQRAQNAHQFLGADDANRQHDSGVGLSVVSQHPAAQSAQKGGTPRGVPVMPAREFEPLMTAMAPTVAHDA